MNGLLPNYICKSVAYDPWPSINMALDTTREAIERFCEDAKRKDAARVLLQNNNLKEIQQKLKNLWEPEKFDDDFADLSYEDYKRIRNESDRLRRLGTQS